MRLARVALTAALHTDGVLTPNLGAAGLNATWANGERIPGVVVVATRGGRYTVDLFLTARLVPLRPLLHAVRERVLREAQRLELRDIVDGVSVTVLDVEDSP